MLMHRAGATHQPAAACTRRSIGGQPPRLHRAQPRTRPCVAQSEAASSTTVVTERGSTTTPAGHDAAAAAASGATTTRSTTSTSSAAISSSLDGFEWQSYWYPVHVLESIDPARPHAIELLGKQLVLWRDGAGRWQCMQDACPHRLAPLSQGRIEGGSLMCSYHGWRFDSQGKCVDVPQALDDKAKAVACSSSRSCVTSFPVREEHGLIWVWPSAGASAAAQAAAAPLPLSKGVVAAAAEGQHLRWYRRELPYSWDILIENLTDPSHLPFSHHNLMPSMKRKNGIAMPFKLTAVPDGDSPDDAAARPPYAFEHRAPLATYEFPSALSPAGYVCFLPPCAVNYEYTLHHMGSAVMQNDLMAVPAGPGRSVAYTLGTSSAPVVTNGDIIKTLLTSPLQLPMTLLRAHFQRRPAHSAHLLANKLFDQDNVFLNMQDREIAIRGKDSWQRQYFMPTPCDGLVIAARKWATEALKLPIPGAAAGSNSSSSSNGSAAAGPTAAQLFSLSAATAAASPRSTAVQINDRLKQHTQHCVVCQAAMRGLQARLRIAQAAAAALGAALLGLLAAAVLPAVLPSSAAVSVGSAAYGPVAAIAAMLAAGAAAAAAIARATAKTLQEFVYVEFSHATNH